MLAAAGCGASGGAEPTTAARPAQAADAALPPGLHGRRAVARVEARQRARFALLRTPPEPIPPATRRLLGPPQFGSSWRLAQRIPIALPGAYWLVPAHRHLCIAERGSMGSPGAGTTCARTSWAIAHGVADVVVHRAVPGASPPARLIVGVAPDGARAVVVRTRGERARVPVVDGVFVHRDALVAPPDALELR